MQTSYLIITEDGGVYPNMLIYLQDDKNFRLPLTELGIKEVVPLEKTVVLSDKIDVTDTRSDIKIQVQNIREIYEQETNVLVYSYAINKMR